MHALYTAWTCFPYCVCTYVLYIYKYYNIIYIVHEKFVYYYLYMCVYCIDRCIILHRHDIGLIMSLNDPIVTVCALYILYHRVQCIHTSACMELVYTTKSASVSVQLHIIYSLYIIVILLYTILCTLLVDILHIIYCIWNECIYVYTYISITYYVNNIIQSNLALWMRSCVTKLTDTALK